VIIISAFVLRWNYRQLLGIAKQIFTNWFLGHRQNIFSIKKNTSRWFRYSFYQTCKYCIFVLSPTLLPLKAHSSPKM